MPEAKESDSVHSRPLGGKQALACCQAVEPFGTGVAGKGKAGDCTP